MKVKVENLGAINKAEIEVKPLTVFVGPNSTGKTWTAYTLSAILGPYGWRQYSRKYASGETEKKYSVLDTAVEQLLENGNAKINTLDFARDYAECYFNDVANFAKDWISEYLDTDKADFSKFKIHIKLDETESALINRIKALQIDKKLSATPQRKQALVNCLKEKGDFSLFFFTTSDTQGLVLDELPKRVIRELLAASTFEVLQRGLFPNVYIFPTERTAFVTMSKIFHGIPDRSDRSEFEIDDGEKPSRGLGKPLSGILGLIRNSFFANQSSRNQQAQENAAIANIVELADILESNILQGKVDFLESSPGAQKELVFKTKNGSQLEMHVSSSMARELTSILLCLRYFAEPDELLIIDEPEMNLHPEAQVRLIEIIAMLVNAGLQVIISTHSSYMVDHLMNLMKAAEQVNPSSIKDKFFLQDERAFISQDKVSVYLFDEGSAESILDNQGQINWDTFAKVTEKIERLFFEM
jgi:predicted ATP-dependent endonuclease of OLD family